MAASFRCSRGSPPAHTTQALAWLRSGQRGLTVLGLLGGAMHLPDPAARMLILNGQVHREGDTVAPGLVIEEIQLRAAVLVLRGQRFSLPY
jgi:hypothetical protein